MAEGKWITKFALKEYKSCVSDHFCLPVARRSDGALLAPDRTCERLCQGGLSTMSDFIWLSVFSSHSQIQTGLVVLDVVSSLPARSPQQTDNDLLFAETAGQLLWADLEPRLED